MFACQRIALNVSKRQFHTVPAISAAEGLFGKFNPWANKTQPEQVVTPAQPTNQDITTFNVKYQDADDIASWKRTDVLTNHEEIESAVKSVILQHVQGATETNWKDLSIDDLNTKFKILKDSIKETGKEVPNYELNGLETTKDVLAYFKTGGPLEAQKVTIEAYFEDNRESLPKNLTFVPRE
ncbi:uncharacterized protein EV154DRAFT_525446 [Mucor mucedo]|uniref:uncharacterized protein n=1 Tax=Mucor mucedo TaxID=29922 RepID=UPI002220BCCB|nr:uncharacterized protein EV154DRAFT_525446 [Mucor mucedo]KAI7877298.1 hypothetical protein EV154DRAFT_525446 [Mucor mucedo]